MSNMHKEMEGFIGGAVAAIIVWPAETVRTQRQVLSTNTIKSCIASIYQKQGLGGFYKGLNYGVAGMSTFYGTYFYLYHFLKTNKRQPIQPFWASYLAANVASTFNNGLYVIRTRRQTQLIKTSAQHNMPLSTTLKREGWKMWTRGLGFTFVKNIEMGCISPCREYLIDSYHIHPIVATFTSKMVFGILLYPLDTARTLRRCESTPKSFRKILYQFRSNPKSAYYGCPLYIARSVPTTVIAFTLYDWLISFTCARSKKEIV